MPRHAAPPKRAVHRSPRADQAHRAGAVTHTIDITRSPAFDVRQRVMTSATRHALALAVVGAGFWIYDIGLLVHH